MHQRLVRQSFLVLRRRCHPFLKSKVSAPDAFARSSRFWNCVNRNDTIGTQQESALNRKLTDRAASPDRYRFAALDVAKLGRHVAGRKIARPEAHLAP